MFWIKLHFHSKFPSFINSQCKVCSYFGSGFAIDVDKNTLVIDMNFFFLSRIWRQFLLNFYVQFNSRNLIVSDPLPHLMVKYMEGFFWKRDYSRWERFLMQHREKPSIINKLTNFPQSILCQLTVIVRFGTGCNRYYKTSTILDRKVNNLPWK